MKTKLAIFLITIVAVCACSKKEPLAKHEYISFYYEQTMCSDPWETSNDDSITLENAAGYLNARDLYVGGLSIEQSDNPGVACAACGCKTGKTIYVTTLNSNSIKNSFIEIGFKQK
jgi:hypothetical protein